MKIANDKVTNIDITRLFIEFDKHYRNVFIHQIEDQCFIYRAIGRKEYKEIIKDARFTDLEKEELICQQCLLYPDPDEFDWDNCDAGLPTELMNVILTNSYINSEENRNLLKNYYRTEMYEADNQMTCIINEAFPTFDIEEIEQWDVEKTLKYFSRAEWKLHNLRGLSFAEPQINEEKQKQETEHFTSKKNPLIAKSEYEEIVSTIEDNIVNDSAEEETTIRGGNKKNKLTPESLSEQEFLNKFPEFRGDNVKLMGIEGLAQPGVDTTPPALRPGF